MESRHPSDSALDRPRRMRLPRERLVAVRRRKGVMITALDRWLAPGLFWVALAFLIVLACLFGVITMGSAMTMRFGAAEVAANRGAPSVAAGSWDAIEEGSAVTDETPAGPARAAWMPCAMLLILLQVVIVGESALMLLIDRRFWRRHLLYCLLPPLRLVPRDHVDGESIWLPRIGWAHVDHRLETRVERGFSIPMILIALAVLPLLGIEYYLQSRAVPPSWYMVVFIRVSESVIWLAFTIEFIVMVSIARNKLGYCRDHWIDIAIILLPFIAVLRVLRWSRLLRLHQVAKAGRVYRLRGLSTRMFRGILVLGVLHRFLQEDPEKQLAKLRQKQTEREFELAQLRAEVADLEARMAEE